MILECCYLKKHSRKRNLSNPFCKSCMKPSKRVTYGCGSFVWPEFSSRKTDLKNSPLREDAFIGRNQTYYGPVFEQIEQSSNKVKLNLSAFLLSPCWLFYRKMNAWGFFFLTVFIVLSFFQNWFVFLLFIFVKLVLGHYGNFMYLKHIEKDRKKSHSLEDAERARFERNHGGTSTLTAVLSALGYLLIFFRSLYLHYFV